MPAAQKTVGISSSVAVFLLIVSICFVVSLSSRELPHDNLCSNHTNTTIELPSYVPNIALICVMLTGIIAIVIFICKKAELTDSIDECQRSRRQYLHRKYSFYSIAIFFIGVCTLDMNYLLVEFACRNSWFACRPNNMEYFVANAVLTMFHIVGMVFAIFEVVVCWMMKHMNFNPSQWVWHLVAVLQAANITMWFHSLLKESYDRIKEPDHSLEAYFSFCKNDSDQNDLFVCSQSLAVARWFLMSAPILFPITIEFNLLVTETLLDRSIGAESHNSNQNAGEGDNDQENEVDNSAYNRPLTGNSNEPNEQTPLLGLNNHVDRETISIGSKMFSSISVLMNTVQLVLCILVFLEHDDRQSQYFSDIYTAYTSVYYLLLIICCVVGMVSSRGFKRQQHAHTSFLEYLLLFATSGVLFQSVKRIVAFVANNELLGRVQSLPVYYMTDLLDLVQVTLQIVFYYYVKNVKLQFIDGENVNRYRVTIFRNIIFVVSTCNFVKWIIDSFLYPHMTSRTTPTRGYVIESWPAFDNIVIPVYIFFRFNSALLFWCIYTDLSRPGRHQHGGVSIQSPQQTARRPISVGDAPVFFHRPTWPSNRWRSRSGRHLKLRPRKRSRNESTGL